MRNLDLMVFNRVFVVYSRDSGLGEKDFRDAFQHIGNITDIHMMKDKATGKPKGMQLLSVFKGQVPILA